MKLAVVVQRYGADINGGAELHARYVAEHLAKHYDVEVVTTCARDYVTWRNELAAGLEQVNGIAVRRFPVSREREPNDFGRRSRVVFEQSHSIADELAWLDAEGPTSSSLIRYLAGGSGGFDYVVFFSARYHHAYHGARAVARRAILVPTAERDPAVAVGIFGPIFRGVRAIMYNSFEERAMLNALADNGDVPGVVVGVGSDVPERTDPARARQKFGLSGRYVIYVGRIDENKGCKELFPFFERYASGRGRDLSLVLVGTSILPIPNHPRIRHLGFLDDRDKFDLMSGAEALIMPSYFESLSMVALEAWALGRPVLANGKCDVLRGQCARSNAGLYYEGYEEFAETLYAIEANPQFRHALGRNGREYFSRHYAWPVVEQKYVDMLAHLADADRKGAPAREMEPLPGWFARRRRTCPPAAEVLAGVPSGPVLAARKGSDHPRVEPANGVRNMAGTVRAVHQVLATLGYGDAIGHEVVGIQRVLRTAGYESDIFVETADPRLEHLTRDYRVLPEASHPQNILFHHFSIGSRASRVAYALPDRMALIYHNITPPEYFIGVHPLLVQLCFMGRRELRAYVDRVSIALGDSEFNRQELEAAGFAPTSVLPVVPSFAHLDVTPSGVLTKDFDDDWVNLIFVGRVIPNKKLDDVIRIFAAYKRHFNPRSRLLFIGSHSGFELYFAMLQNLVATLRVPDVHFMGHITNEDLTSFYDIADVFVCASEHEGFCVPLMEAFHKGVPVVAYAATAVPATMDGGGILYTDKAPLHVASLIDAVVSDGVLAEQVVRAQEAALARMLAKDFRGTLLRFVDQVAQSPAREHPGVAFDFWDQYTRQDQLEELSILRPAIYQALPKAPSGTGDDGAA